MPPGNKQLPSLLAAAETRLSAKEFRILRWVRRSFQPGLINACMQQLQRRVGQLWIHHATKNLRRVYGQEHLENLDSDESLLIVANHRSFFDLYVVTAELIRLGMKKRIVFPVRSKFFFNSYLGFIVNFLMSSLAMYPPIYRERKRAALNLLALDELAELLKQGGIFAGLHPEGTRKLDDDPYSFLPPQAGVGRVIHKSKVKVVPVFIHGLSNDLKQQVKGNFNGRGAPIYLNFGQAIDFGELLNQKSSPRVHKEISTRCMQAIEALAQADRARQVEDAQSALKTR